MSLFKNEVGRPSNETIKKRNIFKGICVLLVLVIIGLVGYILNDKGIINLSNKNTKSSNEKVVTTTKQITTTAESKSEKFDISKITTKDLGKSEWFDNNEIEIYIYGNKLDYDYSTDSIKNTEVIGDAVLLELNGEGGYLLLVNKSGKVLSDFGLKDGMFYMGVNKEYCSDCYGYKVNDNKVTATVTDLGQDVEYTICKNNYHKNVYKEIEVTYKDGEVTTKDLKTLTGQEYAKSHNINCSNVN